MAKRLSMVLFAALATVAMLQSSAVATTYTVGDSTTWSIPSIPNAYSTWAAGKSFKVGDILVFNFMSGQHDVVEVKKTNYDSCSGANPISRQTSSPASITLQKTGDHYYICTVTGHCSAGQKLAINVTGASSPAPQPARSPSPVSSPTLAPRSSSPSPSSSSSPSPSPSQVPVQAPAPAFAPQSSSSSPVPSSAQAPEPSSASPGSPPPTSTSTSPSPDSTTASPPSPTTTGAANPPENSGAGSLGVAGLSATFLTALALVLFN
ncbi:cucumber peeling cupredoxin-like [Humulus lupulus]|uniref:cucumber peeling cupredoxin-like n=1 Tax=Humulus lupulus TaxID=3486 RepID=UPI002B4125AE|nr:cucumber peeling cupredoxin-like [Humulus lupulus]